MQRPISHKDWRLSEPAFRALLECLDEGADSHGEKYLEMRRRLTEYFDRKGCTQADDLADETLNRVARRLQEEGALTGTTPPRYCYIVAKFVFFERLHHARRDPVSLDELSAHDQAEALGVGGNPESERTRTEAEERRHHCLNRCLSELEQPDRELICEYYQGEQSGKIQNRKTMAARLQLSANALAIRACRIRTKLEACVRHCLHSVET
jgi:DNA-directed RNA polymerase specialized sigma24 family protein